MITVTWNVNGNLNLKHNLCQSISEVGNIKKIVVYQN